MDSTNYLTISTITFFFASLLMQVAVGVHGTKGFSLELIHRDSIHSPLYLGNLTSTERIQRLVRFSDIRMRSLNSSSFAMIRPIVDHESALYMVKVGIGSPQTPLYLFMDTGAFHTWTQSDECTECFPQQGPKYKPTTSSSFSLLPRNHPLCDEFHDGRCTYHERYLDGMQSSGYYATDNFVFASRRGGAKTVPGIIFGCSTRSSPNIFNSKIGGTFALGSSRYSFLGQLGDHRTGGRFSYCLVAPNYAGHSYLRFDSDIPTPTENVQSMPILRADRPFYYVNLIGISLDGRRLQLRPNVFAIHPDGTGGFTIDTGSEMTYLISAAYYPIKIAVLDYFSRFRLGVVSGYLEDLDLCYHKPAGFKSYPTMDFHFEGGSVLHLGAKSLFVVFPEKSKFCLTIKPSETHSVLGARMQRKIRFTFDLAGGRVYFHPENCRGT